MLPAQPSETPQRHPITLSGLAPSLSAIDLYSGVGGWSLGLGLASIDTVASYEIWSPANQSLRENLGNDACECDIRSLELSDLPTNADVVVGSPPCTQFSYSNRGGSGNIEDGLLDVARFLEIVEYVDPRFWIMENVPRLANILAYEVACGSLRRYAHLVDHIHVLDMSKYGLPQRRRRMLAGRFPLERLESYGGSIPTSTLGDIVSALGSNPVVDPIYGTRIDRSLVSDQETEPPLSPEELRMNREAKTFHPVYNAMRFPDSDDQPARTVTATCTRVSRESIVIRSPEADHDASIRRLTVRERASLQSFPVTYQFFATTYTDKLKMVGNAFPPLISYLVGQSLHEVDASSLPHPGTRVELLPKPKSLAPSVPGGVRQSHYPASRRYRAAIPGLRFGSGVRFELANQFTDGMPTWAIGFYFGTSNNILRVALDNELLEDSLSAIGSSGYRIAASNLLDEFSDIANLPPSGLQDVWAHRTAGQHPFDVTDLLGNLSDRMQSAMPPASRPQRTEFVLKTIAKASKANGTRWLQTGLWASTHLQDLGLDVDDMGRVGKMEQHAEAIFAGFLVGSWFNTQVKMAGR